MLTCSIKPHDYPPGFSKVVIRLAPRRYRADALQEAWCAYMEGRHPNSAASNYVKKELLHERRELAESQLTPEEQEEFDLI